MWRGLACYWWRCNYFTIQNYRFLWVIVLTLDRNLTSMVLQCLSHLAHCPDLLNKQLLTIYFVPHNCSFRLMLFQKGAKHQKLLFSQSTRNLWMSQVGTICGNIYKFEVTGYLIPVTILSMDKNFLQPLK